MSGKGCFLFVDELKVMEGWSETGHRGSGKDFYLPSLSLSLLLLLVVPAPLSHQYEGEMENGQFEGKGTYTFPDGSRYEGEFKNGSFHGEGTLFLDNGRYEATWENGKVVFPHPINVDMAII